MIGERDDPARRLMDLLHAARQQNQQENAAKGWSAVFNVRYPEDRVRLLELSAQTAGLATEIRARVNAISDVDSDLTLRHFGAVEQTVAGFAAMDAINMGQFLAGYNDTVSYGLEHCSSVIRRHDPDPLLSDTDVVDLKVQVRELIDSVVGAGLDSQTTRWIVDRLQEVENCLLNLQVLGFSGLERAADSLIGGLKRNPGIFQRIANSKSATIFVQTIVALDLLLNLSANTQQLLPGKGQESSPVVIELKAQIYEIHSIPPGHSESPPPPP